MCITNAKAKLAKTKILSFKLDNGNHYLAYSNTVKNESGNKNAMILPIPGELKQEWFYNTTEYKNYLNDIANQTVVSEYYRYGERSRGIGKGFLSFDKFNVGQYLIVFSKDIELFEHALKEQNVNLTAELKEFFVKQYTGFTYVGCIFDSNTTIDAQPLAFEYTPINPEYLFFPTMDAHDGDAPKEERVKIDHDIITVITSEDDKQLVNFKESEKVPGFLKKQIFGTYQLDFNDTNGDFYVDSKKLFQPTLKRSFKSLI